MPRLSPSILCVLLLVTIVLSSCRKDPGGTVVSQSKQECTPEEARLVGQTLKMTISENSNEFPLLDSSAHTEELIYLNTLLTTLTNTGPVLNRSEFEWGIEVIKDDHEKNLFSLPGGQLYITTGMLKLISNETELLSLLGHEVLYVDRGHVERSLIKKFGGDKLGDILLGEAVPELGEMTQYLKGISYPEETVMKADSFAVELICPFLYDPLGLQTFLKRTRQGGDQIDVAWLDNRWTDDLNARIERINQHARNCGDFGRKFEERYQDFQAKLPE